MTIPGGEHPAVPEKLADLPVCPRHGLPVPYVNQRDDGPPDFSTIFGNRVLACARRHLCGVCGRSLTYWVAFLGGRRSAEARAFLDPPMHVSCAEAAALLCPFIVPREFAITEVPVRSNPRVVGRSWRVRMLQSTNWRLAAR